MATWLKRRQRTGEALRVEGKLGSDDEPGAARDRSVLELKSGVERLRGKLGKADLIIDA